MSDSPPEFDLKFLPDWLKETPSTNRYADYQGDTGDRPRRDRDDRRGPPRGDRPPERRGPRPPGGDRSRGPRPGGGERPRGDRSGGGRRDEQRPFRRDDRGQEPPRPAPQAAPAELRVEFQPEPNAAAGIARQIKMSMRAYAVFGTAKLFLERPERHGVRVTSSKPDVLLYQIGDGPISFDRAAVERGAFQQAKDEFYTEETVQGEPIKGNFTNVARSRTTGVLLGPTNHHGYQPALRKLFEERFSRRMSFQEFQQQEIETVSSEQAVADWKEQARTSTTYTTTKEAEPVTFKSLFDAEQHFRKHYLPGLVKSGTTLTCDGPASRVPLDRHVGTAIRNAWEQERVFPQGVVNGLRSFFSEAGLHYFKHRKRVLHVSAVKPLRHAADQPFSDGITAILNAVEAQPRIKRPDLAKRILGPGHDTPEATERKAQLASDVHYLVQMGHLVEFSDGSFELPLGPKGEQASPAPKTSRVAVSGAAVVAAEPHPPTEPVLESLSSELSEAEVIADEPVIGEENIAPDEPELAASTLESEPLPIVGQLTQQAESASLPEPQVGDLNLAAEAPAEPALEEFAPEELPVEALSTSESSAPHEVPEPTV